MYAQSISLEKLKEQVIQKYTFAGMITVKMIKYSENINFFVKDEENGKKYALRLCKPDYHDEAELEGEMLWIAKVKEDTDIIVANPIQGKDGHYVQKLYFEDEENPQMPPQSYNCCLFSFLEGTILKNINDNSQLKKYNEKIGEITAKFHKQVENWPHAAELKRFTWNFEDLLGDHPRWGKWQNYSGITNHQREIYNRAEIIIKDRIFNYGKEKNRYGLIHTDLNLNNIIVEGDKIQVLDFDDCGFGWFLYDCGTTLLEYEDNLEDMLKAWISGYEKVRKLSEQDKAEIITFIMMRKLVRLAWIGTHYDNDTVKKIPDSYYKYTEWMAERYCKTQDINDFFE